MEQIFKLSKLESVDDIELIIKKYDYTTNSFVDGKKISLEKTCLSFEIGNDKNGFSFYSSIAPEEFLEFELGKRINFREYMDFDDFDFGIDGKPMVVDNISSEIIHYLDKKFMIIIYLQAEDFASHIQIDFDISEFLD